MVRNNVSNRLSSESLADVTPGRQYEALLIVPKGVERVQRLPARLRAHAAAEHDQVFGKASQAVGQEVEMVPSFRQHYRRAPRSRHTRLWNMAASILPVICRLPPPIVLRLHRLPQC